MQQSRAKIEGAADFLKPHILKTPIFELPLGMFGIDAQIILKLENHQITGSFKPRGAFYNILKNLDRAACGLIAASGGNHGAAVAYVARKLNLPCEIFVPAVSSLEKRKILESLGATVTVVGKTYAEALLAAEEKTEKTNAHIVRAFEDEATIIGQGTLALEFEKQYPNLDLMIMAVGGAGLIAGATLWLEKRVAVIGVEPEMAPTLFRAIVEGRPTNVTTGGIAADALGCKCVGEKAFEIVNSKEIATYLVSEDQIHAAQRALWNELRITVEPSAALPLALLRSKQLKVSANQKVGLVLCGANGINPF